MKYSSYDLAQAFNCVGSSLQSLPRHTTPVTALHVHRAVQDRDKASHSVPCLSFRVWEQSCLISKLQQLKGREWLIFSHWVAGLHQNFE